MSTGIKYTEKKGSYVIEFDDKYKQKIFNGIITDIVDFHVAGDVYNITYSKLIDLIHKHAVSRPLSSSILMSKKQFILSYIYEQLPESFAYREMLTDMASKLNDIEKFDSSSIQLVLNGINTDLEAFLEPLQAHLYGTYRDNESSTYLSCYFYTVIPTSSNDINLFTQTSINMAMKRIVDDCVKYLQSNYDSIPNGYGLDKKYK